MLEEWLIYGKVRGWSEYNNRDGVIFALTSKYATEVSLFAGTCGFALAMEDDLE